VGLKDRRSNTDISTGSVLYLFDIDIIERNALRAAAELPLLDVQTEMARLNAFREENYFDRRFEQRQPSCATNGAATAMIGSQTVADGRCGQRMSEEIQKG
jgi:hypothetical protein